MSEKVLITGGLGFIGSNLAHAYAGSGAAVTVYDSLDPACGGDPANLAGIVGEVAVVRDDIRSASGVASAVAQADLVVNCAAYTSHLGSMRDPAAYVDVNCVGLLRLLEAAAARATPPRFVQIGTSTQVGRALAEPITEEHPEFPLDVYSATKTAAEKLALAYGGARGIPVSVVRLGNVYGPRAKMTDPGLGFVNFFVGLALAGKDLTVFGSGEQRRTITFVSDVVEAIQRVARSNETVGQAYFAAHEADHSVREVADAIVRAIGRGQVRQVDWPRDRSAIEVGDSRISSAKIARAVGWRAGVGLDEGMRLTARHLATRQAAP